MKSFTHRTILVLVGLTVLMQAVLLFRGYHQSTGRNRQEFVQSAVYKQTNDCCGSQLDRRYAPSWFAIEVNSSDRRPILGIGQEFELHRQMGRGLQGHVSSWALTGFGFLFEGELDRDCLDFAIALVLMKHESLRTGFVPVASVGALELRGWSAIKGAFQGQSLQPKLRFEGFG